MDTTSLQVDVRKAGVKVRHAHNPSKVGETTGEVRFRAGRDVATIRLTNGEVTYIPVDQLEALPRLESRIEAFALNRTRGPGELARQLLMEKISGLLKQRRIGCQQPCPRDCAGQRHQDRVHQQLA